PEPAHPHSPEPAHPHSPEPGHPDSPEPAHPDSPEPAHRPFAGTGPRPFWNRVTPLRVSKTNVPVRDVFVARRPNASHIGIRDRRRRCFEAGPLEPSHPIEPCIRPSRESR
ncbi:MAG: hypothetical protein KJO11_05100, partial [Gemmatimonadetes bacterium]|nr:hypothetical protein [Gemmatimonadota bacterium]